MPFGLRQMLKHLVKNSEKRTKRVENMLNTGRLVMVGGHNACTGLC